VQASLASSRVHKHSTKRPALILWLYVVDDVTDDMLEDARCQRLASTEPATGVRALSAKPSPGPRQAAVGDRIISNRLWRIGLLICLAVLGQLTFLHELAICNESHAPALHVYLLPFLVSLRGFYQVVHDVLPGVRTSLQAAAWVQDCVVIRVEAVVGTVRRSLPVKSFLENPVSEAVCHT
jgi:hypothetical protein